MIDFLDIQRRLYINITMSNKALKLVLFLLFLIWIYQITCVFDPLLFVISFYDWRVLVCSCRGQRIWQTSRDTIHHFMIILFFIMYSKDSLGASTGLLRIALGACVTDQLPRTPFSITGVFLPYVHSVQWAYVFSIMDIFLAFLGILDVPGVSCGLYSSSIHIMILFWKIFY